MSKIADTEANATSLDSLVNDNALVTTLRNGPKPSYQYLVDGWNTEFNALIDNIEVQGDNAIALINADVVTVEAAKNSAISSIDSDLSAFDAYYQSARDTIGSDVAEFAIDSDAALAAFELNASNSLSEFTQESAEAFNEFDLTLDQYKESRGFNTKGTFANGFTYELPNDVGLDADGNPWILIDTSSLPVIVSAGTTPSNPPYKQVAYGTAAQVSTNTSDTVQSFVDSFALKIFQSPTDGGLTEIQTRTVDAGEAYEVRKTSDDSLATIYSDATGTTEILQNGTDNKSGSDSVVEFYISDGSYSITSSGELGLFSVISAGGIVRTVTLSDAKDDLSPLGTLYSITDRNNGKYTKVSGEISDGYWIVGTSDGNQLKYSPLLGTASLEVELSKIGAKDSLANTKPVTDSAILNLNSSGGVIIHDLNKLTFTEPLVLPPLIDLKGVKKSHNVTPSFIGLEPTGSEFHFSNSDGIQCSGGGFNNLSNFIVSGTSGGYVGISTESSEPVSPNINSSGVSIRGFLDGVGFVMSNLFRDKHSDLDIQKCGLGLLWKDVVNSTKLDNIIIENCAVGWLCAGGTYRANDVFGTIEGNEKGKFGVSFPSSLMVSVPVDILTDLGVNQSNLEGGLLAVGLQSNINCYFESNSLAHVYAGVDSLIDFTGSYFNDALTLIGSNKVRPRNLINAKRSRGVKYKYGYVSVKSDRVTPLFDINTSFYNDIGFNRYLSTAGVYTGDLYENSGSGVVDYLNSSDLRDLSNKRSGIRSNITANKNSSDASVSGTTNLDCSDSTAFFMTLTGDTNFTFSGASDGQLIDLHVIQGGAGGYNMSFSSGFRLSFDDTGNLLNKKTSFQFRYRTSDSRFYQIGAQSPYHD